MSDSKKDNYVGALVAQVNEQALNVGQENPTLVSKLMAGAQKGKIIGVAYKHDQGVVKKVSKNEIYERKNDTVEYIGVEADLDVKNAAASANCKLM